MKRQCFKKKGSQLLSTDGNQKVSSGFSNKEVIGDHGKEFWYKGMRRHVRLGSFIHSFSKYIISIYDMPGTRCWGCNEQNRYNPYSRERKPLNK